MPDEADKCRIFVSDITNIQHFSLNRQVFAININLKHYYYGNKRFKERARTP